jgi:signal transduction histidine kinase
MLRTRLFLNLLLFAAILLALGVYAIALFARLASSLDVTVTESYRSILAAQSMSQALAGMEEIIRDDTGTRAADDGLFAECRKQFEDNLATQLQNAKLAGERQLNGQLGAAYYAFLKAATAPQPLRTPKGQIENHAVASSTARINTALNKIRLLNYQAVLAASRNLQQNTREVTRLMIVGIGVVLIISACACYLLSRSILRPILSLTKATRELGEGKPAQPLRVAARDELGELAAAFNKMAAQLAEYRRNTSEEIVRLHRTMESTLASFPDPIFVLNKEGLVELKNPAAEDLTTTAGLHDQLPERLRAIAREALASGEHFLPHSFNEAICYRNNGAEKFFLPRILAMRDKENVLFGVAVVLYDVTRFRLLDAAKTNLVATVSHELKTPLTSVRMALHILIEKTVGALNPKQDELLKTARNDSERLLRILNDLLDLARLEEGTGELRKEKMAPAELLQAAIEETADKLSARGLKVHCPAVQDLPAVLVDRQRINYVFTNLIINAVKYSPAGGEVLLQATRTEDDGIQFSITDQGPGIAEEYHSRIFDRFFRVPGQNKTGAGLGLSIAREIIVAHGGRIGVRSSPGHGSTFFVILKTAD